MVLGQIDVSSVQKDWLQGEGAIQIRALAQHCGIYKDLFGPFAFFDPLVPLAVEYDYDGETFTPVYRGNIVKPREASNLVMQFEKKKTFVFLKKKHVFFA